MARVNKREAPYYDDFDASKGYYQLLAIPGRVAQAREITQLQSVLLNIVKGIGDASYRDGDVIEGCQVIIADDKKSVKVTAGSVYMEGVIIPVEEVPNLAISGEGIENIGVKLMEKIVNEKEDESLRDPAQGYDNFGQPGCDRLKRWVEITVNDPEAVTITPLIDGAVSVETMRPESTQMEQTLARRTYDESGSYIVDGLSSHVEVRDENSYNVVVDPGKAYVLGYELKLPSTRRLQNTKSTEVLTVSASNYTYHTGTSDYLLDSHPYVKEIKIVKGNVSSGSETHNISSNVDKILLNNTDVVGITSVAQGATTYTYDNSGDTTKDCMLVREGTLYYLQWNGHNAPASGSTFVVKYDYRKTFSSTDEYELKIINGGHYLHFKSTAEGKHPLNNTGFEVSYDEYLARKDALYIDQYGGLYISQGVPAEYGYEVEPDVPVNTLALAIINNPPNGTADITDTLNEKISVANVGLVRFTMNDIQDLLNRIKRNEYDQAVLALNDDARNVYTSNTKKGILTDPLIDLSRVDLFFNLDSDGSKIDVSKPIYDMALDFTTNRAYLPVVSNTFDLSINTSKSTAYKYNRLAGLARSGEKVFLSQDTATIAFQVNPYTTAKGLPEVSVDPAIDTWVEDTTIVVPVSLTGSAVVSTSSRIIDKRWNKSKVVTTQVGTTTSTSSSTNLISSEAITYMRRRTITVTGTNFAPGVNRISCTFDGKRVALTPAPGWNSGDEAGTVQANVNGVCKATFMIPEGVRTGIREVKLSTPETVAGYANEGYTAYQATGTKRTFQKTITTLTTVLLNNETRYYRYDPIAQTFTVDGMKILKGIDVYFQKKTGSNIPITLELRNVETNGYIGKTVYGSVTKYPSEINTSQDASVATRFNFSDPIILEDDTEYAFVLRTTSDLYNVWVSEVGGIDVTTGKQVARNPYLTGVMMSSSNNSSWSVHQTMDIKFKLVSDVYASTSTLQFNQVTVANATRLLVVAESAIPTSTNINWLYSIDNGSNWYPISEDTLKELDTKCTKVDIKAELTTSNSELSPFVALDTAILVASSYDTSGTYITKNVTGLSSFTSVRIVLDTYTARGGTIVPKVSVDNGATLVTATLDSSSIVQLDDGWLEQTYNATVPSGSTQCRIFIEATSPQPYITPQFQKLRCIMS